MKTTFSKCITEKFLMSQKFQTVGSMKATAPLHFAGSTESSKSTLILVTVINNNRETS